MKQRLLLLALPFALPLLLAAGNPATENEHVVKDGETLDGIANRAGVESAVIAAANGLAEPYNVRKGQRLQIPRQRTHRVRGGETLRGIANRYNVPFTNLAIANGLRKPYPIRIGQRLIVPAVLKRPPPATAIRTTPYFRRPHDGRVLLGYSYKNGRGHDGVDYAANPGDMVRASSSGTVIFAGSDPARFGRKVVIDHGNGWQTLYGHLERITVKKGELVKTGERVGIAGDAGAAERVELHFEMRRRGVPVNPAGRLERR